MRKRVYGSAICKRILAVAFALSFLVAIAACGDDEAPTATTAPRPTAVPTATALPEPTATEAMMPKETPTEAMMEPTATEAMMPKETPTEAMMEPTATEAMMPKETPTEAMMEPTATEAMMPKETPTESMAMAGPTLPATVTDAFGNEVTVDDVSRIVVLNGDFTEVVFALGMGQNVVAVDVSATYPAEALRLPKIGYQRSLSAEGILAMGPTLVIGSTSAGPPEVIEQIRSTGVPVVILPPAGTLDGVTVKIRGIAQALGVTERGEKVAAEVEAQIAEVRALAEQAEEKPTAVFFYLRGADTILMAGTSDLSHELFEASGAVSGAAVARIHAPFVPLTAEALVAADPDCIVLFTTGLESVGGVEGLKEIPGVAQTTAAEEGCILDFDGQYVAGGGPRTGQVLMELLAAFHPDLAA